MSDLVIYEKQGKIGLIKLNRPPVNSYNHDMVVALGKAIDEIRFDDQVQVGILTGAKHGMFSAGADINMLKNADPDYKAMFCLNCQETLTKMESTPKLFIAALGGTCVGGGLEQALACDLRFMTDNPKAVIGLPEITLGVLPGTGGTQRLPRLVGKGRALDLMITGKLIGAQEAHRIGLVEYVFPDAEFMDKTLEHAERMANGPARAVNLIKRSVQEGTELDLRGGLALERELQNRLFATQDAKEGLSAFVEKRKPQFSGR